MFGINSEADRLLKSLFQYARKRRDEGVSDFTDILNGFYHERLLDSMNDGRNAITKRFCSLVKEYVETDPRYQKKMDEFAML